MSKQKTVEMKDQRSGLPCPAYLGTWRGQQCYEIGPVILSVDDILKLAGHAMVSGPMSDESRSRFKKNIEDLTVGEGVGGVSIFRPSVERQLAGTASPI